MGTNTAVKNSIFENYQLLEGVYDEFFQSNKKPHPYLENLVNMLEMIGKEEISFRQLLAETAFHKGGITFTVYTDPRGLEKTIPFDLIPRTISGQEWEKLEKGLIQRIETLNLFLNDIYDEQKILKDKIIPKFLVETSTGYIHKLIGIKPPGGVYIHVAGIDLVRLPNGEYVVLEDNLRCPSGVSYLLENRQIMKRTFPKIFPHPNISSVNEYPMNLRKALASLAHGNPAEAYCAVLTPGPYNSAYYEHVFLARNMGCELVQSQDLFIANDQLYVKTTHGSQRVDVLYRRIDDDFIDPEFFRPDSFLGVKGIMRAYAKGNIVLANAVGNGVADEKGIYPYVPKMIRYYLGEDPILNQVETYPCHDPKKREYVLKNLEDLVVKTVNASGGYGMLFGPSSTQREIKEFEKIILANPRNFIAQPVVELSTSPTWIEDSIQPRRVDLRPFIIKGKTTWVVPGGFTRVARTKGSYIVNSSQGGGSKDTWVIQEKEK